ncbi:unnamed protein product [Linum tenue]|uniref:Ubiquitin-like protease family profile domain-containing protein n=1 Tax=Linum tenue TaxID=586396 RepID=A0AAV0IWG0_9ROSI|nr:unnamed protein product [Linum tenue]
MVNARSTSRFSVFDFSEEDELPEQASKMLIGRVRNRKRPKRVASPITKYKFLECFMGRKGSADVADKGSLQNKNHADPINVDDDPVSTCSEGKGTLWDVFSYLKSYVKIQFSFTVRDGVNALSMHLDFSAGATGIGVRDPGYHQVSVVSCLPQRDGPAKGRAPFSECTELSSDSDNERNEAATSFDDDYPIEMSRPLASVSTSTEKEDPLEKQAAALGSVGHKIKKDEDGSFGHICWSTSQLLASSLELDGNHKEVVYPKDDPDAVLITTRDLELLQPATFINDTIIDFYVKYLVKTKIQPEDHNRFHFFNSFYFRKLADLDKDMTSVGEGRAAFQRVHKWTKKVTLFEKEYIFIPVNYSLHWSLIVICHPDDVKERSVKLPCILHMDSIQGSHRGLKNLFQSYLLEEWKARHQDIVDDVSSKFLNMSFIELELPQQANSFDCGLFLLHYLELFIEDVPANFNPFDLSKFSNFLKKNWFPPDEASLKRIRIQKLISGVLLHHPEGTPLVDYMKKYPSSQICSNSREKVIEVAILQEQCSSPKTCPISASRSNIEPRIGHSPPATSHSAFHDRMGEAGMDFLELSIAYTNSKSLLYDKIHQQKQTHQSTNLSPMKEVEEVCDSFSGSEDKLGNGGSPGTPSFIIREFTLSPEAPRKQKHVQADELSNDCSSGSQKSSEIGVDELGAYVIEDSENRNSLQDGEEFCSETRKEVDEGLQTYVIEDSEDRNSLQDREVVEDSISSVHDGGSVAAPLCDHSTDNGDVSSRI